MSARHPARVMPYRELVEGLRDAVDKKLVTEQVSGDLRLYCYSNSCVYERAWGDITTLARGLIIDAKRECVVATPFPKFFNYGERAVPIPDLPFEVFEKLDGSLIVAWHDSDTGWRCVTKGSFKSEQAIAARRWMADCGIDRKTDREGRTFLFEWVAPDNRIVVPYAEPELVMLAAYAGDGREYSRAEVAILAYWLGVRAVPRYPFISLPDLVAHASALPATQEGFVLRFANGLRLKIKGDEYRRIHALISRCTPLAMWEAMAAGDDLDLIRRQLPEEFWVDFDTITAALSGRVSSIAARVGAEAAAVANLSDKEVGLRLDQWPEDVRPFIFPYRKYGGDLMKGKTRQTLFRSIRPTGNVLPGYTPSYAMNRVFEEAA